MRNNFQDYKYQLRKINKYIEPFSALEKEKIKKVINFAREQHRGQRHSHKLPYSIHLIRAALILVEEVKLRDANLICAIILHDVLEDCPVTYKKLEKLFGRTIAKLVLGVTRFRKKDETEKDKIINKVRKIKEISRANKKIRLIKLCDVLDNNRSEKYLSCNSRLFKKIPRWHKEFKLYLPIARRTNKKIYQLLVNQNKIKHS